MSLHRSLGDLSTFASLWLATLTVALFAAPATNADEPATVFVDDAESGAETEAANAADETAESDDDADDESADEAAYHLAHWLQEPVVPDITFSPTVTAPVAATELTAALFGDDAVARSLLSDARRARATSPSSNIVIGQEGKFRIATDAGNLLGKSRNGRGIALQKRTPIVSDPRIRGDRVGRLVASGSYWFPARQDLDTMLNKIDSRLIADMIVIKGPYSVRYGPGFDFVDFELLASPRFDGYNWAGSTSLEYLTNGAQWYGRQMVMAGDEDYGYRVSYGHRTGNDYRTGSGTTLPTSYNSRDLDVALGYDLADGSAIEFNYLRLDQTGVEFPGLVFDINALVTDGFTLRYAVEDLPHADLFTIEGWYNATRFYGDTLRPGKNRQIPSLGTQLAPFGFFVPGYARTDVDAYSAGTRLAASWGDLDTEQLTIGADFTRLGQQLNDIEDADSLGAFTGAANFPIPRSHSSDIGIFTDVTTQATDHLRINMGGRVDFVDTDSRDTAPEFFDYGGTGATTYSQIKQAGLDQSFTLGAAHITAEYDINPCWTLTGGVGHGQRAPTMTELYAGSSFIGSLQPGLTTLEGDPELKSEKRTQIDLGLRGDLGETRLSANGFYAWMRDAIIYEHFDALDPFFIPSSAFQKVVFGNTDRATLAGFELYAERDLRPNLAGFASLTYVEGRDHTRNEPTRLGRLRRQNTFTPYTGTENRSVANNDDEPLPGIAPMEAILGLRLHEPVVDPNWGLELEARIVDNQDRVASSLIELPTPGFTIWNLRGFWRPCDRLTLIGGVENFTDKFYREHLDYRSGLGVFQPGVNFYFSTELIY